MMYDATVAVRSVIAKRVFYRRHHGEKGEQKMAVLSTARIHSRTTIHLRRGPLFWPLCLEERTQRRQEIKSSIYLPRKDRHVCPGVTMLHCETWSCERNTKRRRYQLCQCGTGAVRCNPRDEARPNKREDVEVKH